MKGFKTGKIGPIQSVCQTSKNTFPADFVRFRGTKYPHSTCYKAIFKMIQPISHTYSIYFVLQEQDSSILYSRPLRICPMGFRICPVKQIRIVSRIFPNLQSPTASKGNGAAYRQGLYASSGVACTRPSGE